MIFFLLSALGSVRWLLKNFLHIFGVTFASLLFSISTFDFTQYSNLAELLAPLYALSWTQTFGAGVRHPEKFSHRIKILLFSSIIFPFHFLSAFLMVCIFSNIYIHFSYIIWCTIFFYISFSHIFNFPLFLFISILQSPGHSLLGIIQNMQRTLFNSF